MESDEKPMQVAMGFKNRAYIFLHALAFVIGFSLVFVIGWGGATTLIGQLFIQYKVWIARLGGLILIIFGLATMDILHIPWFYMDTRPEFKGKTGTFWGSIGMGLFFAAGWSPCIGATLGAILTLGLSADTVGQAMVLSLGYSLGMGVWFLLMALALELSLPLVRKMRKHLRIFQTISGVLILIIGVLLITAQFTEIARRLMFLGIAWDLPNSGVPSFITAIAAGALSFFSPCVLPLVPAYLGYLSGHMIEVSRQKVTI